MSRRGRRVSDEKMYRACVEYELNSGELKVWESGPYATPAPAKAARTHFLKYGSHNRTVLRKYMEVAEMDWQEIDI